MAGIGAASSIGGAAIASSGAQNAAQAQAGAAEQAAQLQYQSAQQALAFQKQVYGNQQQELSPWYMAGEGGLANLENLLGVPVQGNVVNPGQLAAASAGANGPNIPSIGNNLGRSPQMQGPMGQVQQQLQQNGLMSQPAAMMGGAQGGPPMSGPIQVPVRGTAMGSAGTPNTTNAPTGTANGQQPLSSLINPSLGATGSLMQPWTQQFQAPTSVTEQNDPGYQFRLQQGTQALQNSAAASGDLLSGNTLAGITQYGQNYASNEYNNVYNRAFNQYATAYNQFQQNQANQYNRLASLAGVGQTTAGQLGYLGSNAAQGISGTLLGSAGQIGQSLQNAGAANASGYVGSANAWGGALGNLGNLGMLAAMYGQGGGGGGAGGLTTSSPNLGAYDPNSGMGSIYG